MKTQYYTASSLDGFIAGPDHDLSWLFQLDSGNEGPPDYDSFISQVGAIAMGSSTYEWILRHHVHVDPEKPQAWPYEQPCWVFTSRTLPVVPEANLQFVRGDVGPVHKQMLEAAGGKNIWVVGGGELVGQFYDQGLLDELIIQVGSVTLGAGYSLLPRRIPLRLVSVKAFGEAFAELRYEVRKEEE